MYKEKIVDAETGEISWRDYTAAEIAAVEKAQAEAAALIANEAAIQSAKTAILEKLGLSEQEAQILFS